MLFGEFRECQYEREQNILTAVTDYMIAAADPAEAEQRIKLIVQDQFKWMRQETDHLERCVLSVFGKGESK